MRILIPILDFARTGGSRVLSNLANEWTNQGCEVMFLVHQSSGKPYFPTDAHIEWLPQSRLVLHRVIDRMITLKKGVERHAELGSVILANHSLTAWPVALARTQASKFYYVQAYEPELIADVGGAGSWPSRVLSHASYGLKLTRIVNAPIYRSYKNLQAVHVVPPGLDMNIFYPKEPTVPGSTGEWVVGTIGRSEPWKGTGTVIDACNLLHEAGCPIKLRIAYGHVPPGYKVPEYADVCIPKNDFELSNFYRSVDVLMALGKLQLGAAHYPVMEAMACGVPVVTTGYMPASQDNAWIVPIDNPERSAEAVMNIFRDLEVQKEKVHKAKQEISSYTWNAVSLKLLSIFQSIDLSSSVQD
jgi:glycosyltransferase involved in cell wall biosynthesis